MKTDPEAVSLIPTRRPYRQPRLQELGEVTALTMQASPPGNKKAESWDGNGFGPKKLSF